MNQQIKSNEDRRRAIYMQGLGKKPGDSQVLAINYENELIYTAVATKGYASAHVLLVSFEPI